ncbi:chemotaxis protein CheR [Pistricoccus aurantiacus]|uniref:Chemotaxis protein methyltransferase n=1 Tax=Pistricoccus aurantiacus TaxID=1883414 RepID=A0A5B8ST22_9GAMM|nr:CheR family methyltransferase [Pistricoccus aurantiacus]QEA40262.1 chemotaxis protein CheR [Pistricoccus aurantiacus]
MFNKRDLVLMPADFERIRRLIYARAGIVLTEHKKEMVYSRLARRLQHHGMADFKEYIDQLERYPGSSEWDAFTNALTTNLTAFFREAHHFPLLAAHIAERRAPIRIWCAAASTGEEPYSIAMTAIETLGSAAANQVQVIGTDIDTDALEIARSGIYSVDQVLKLGPERVRRFFQRGKGSRGGLARVHPTVSRLVEFKSLNLCAPRWPLDGPFDVIFCRNVMIYFDRKTQAEILQRFAPMLKPDGLLIAGHSENFTQMDSRFRLLGKTVYGLK